MSREVLAERANLTVSYLSMLERGKRDPSISTVEALAVGLEVPISVLVFLASDPSEIRGLDEDLAQKLSYAAFKIMQNDNPQETLL